MAKVKFSAMISGMSGKLNGSVFARNRGGDYLRTKVTPSNPQTAAQSAVRSVFGSLSQAWRSLTEAQRTAWRSVVDQWQSTDVFGDLKSPSGSNLYVRLNVNAQKVNAAPINEPPNPRGVPSPIGVSLVLDAAGGTVTINSSVEPGAPSLRLLIEATPAVSAGINNANTKFRILSVNQVGLGVSYDLSAAYAAKFGGFSAGQKVFARVSVVDGETGEQTPPIVVSDIA